MENIEQESRNRWWKGAFMAPNSSPQLSSCMSSCNNLLWIWIQIEFFLVEVDEVEGRFRILSQFYIPLKATKFSQHFFSSFLVNLYTLMYFLLCSHISVNINLNPSQLNPHLWIQLMYSKTQDKSDIWNFQNNTTLLFLWTLKKLPTCTCFLLFHRVLVVI